MWTQGEGGGHLANDYYTFTFNTYLLTAVLLEEHSKGHLVPEHILLEDLKLSHHDSDTSWVKKESRFDVAMGNVDGAEVTNHVGLFQLTPATVAPAPLWSSR